VILVSGPEITSIRNPTTNKARKYLAGVDEIESWDKLKMAELGLTPQFLS
jgi:hypothetical protein